MYATLTIFSNKCIVTLTFDLLIPKSIGHILNSWRVGVRGFMMIGVKEKRLCNISNNCILTLSFDLLTPKSIGHILNSWGSVCDVS